MTEKLDVKLETEEEKEVYRLHGEDCISEQEDKPCYGKPCSCLVCHHEEYFCIDHSQGPCSVCGGEDHERAIGLCEYDPESD